MSLNFKSIKSSSSGNCIFVWTDTTSLLIDCGLGSMKKTRSILSESVGDIAEIDAVLISHTHSDHISYYPLRVLEEYNKTVFTSDRSIEQFQQKHFRGYGFSGIDFQYFNGSGFQVGDMQINPFPLKHHPDFPTYGFEILHRVDNDWKKLVLATDFSDLGSEIEYFLDADAIYIESNHDLDLLRKFYNPNSRYHLSNPNTARLIHEIYQNSDIKCENIMLAHMSKQRNEHSLALSEVKNFFAGKKTHINFNLTVAPPDVPSQTVTII